MGRFSGIVDEFGRLAKTPLPELVYRLQPKGGRFQFYITEPELLEVLKCAPPPEYAPYVVTFHKKEYLRGPESCDCTEALEEFAGWTAHETYAVYVWPEELYREVKSRRSKRLLGVAGTFVPRVTLSPIELFRQNKIPEDSSMISVYGSGQPWDRSGPVFVNEVGTRIFKALRRAIEARIAFHVVHCFESGDCEDKLMGMSRQAAELLGELPGPPRVKPGRAWRRRTSF
jgi:hypothetical protein